MNTFMDKAVEIDKQMQSVLTKGYTPIKLTDADRYRAVMQDLGDLDNRSDQLLKDIADECIGTLERRSKEIPPCW